MVLLELKKYQRNIDLKSQLPNVLLRFGILVFIKVFTSLEACLPPQGLNTCPSYEAAFCFQKIVPCIGILKRSNTPCSVCLKIKRSRVCICLSGIRNLGRAATFAKHQPQVTAQLPNVVTLQSALTMPSLLSPQKRYC